MPCFPRKEPKVVHPEQTVPHKNVHRYGETQIRRLELPLRREQWKKGAAANPNEGRPLPATPRPEHHVEKQHIERQTTRRKKTRPVARNEVEVEREEYQEAAPVRRKPPRPRPVHADFYVSVPIFNETLNHSYRKKNEYVYVDGDDDDTSLYHQSLSRASSMRDLNLDSSRDSAYFARQRSHYQHSHTDGSQYSDRKEYREKKKRPRSVHRHSGHPKQASIQRPRHWSGSEASYNTFSSRGTYGYESESFERARLMRSGPRSALSIDSDEEDYR